MTTWHAQGHVYSLVQVAPVCHMKSLANVGGFEGFKKIVLKCAKKYMYYMNMLMNLGTVLGCFVHSLILHGGHPDVLHNLLNL